MIAAFSQALLSGTLVHYSNFEELKQRYQIHTHPQSVFLVSIDRYYEICIGKPFLWRSEIAEQLLKGIQRVVSQPYLWLWVEEGVLALLLEWEQKIQQEDGFYDGCNRLASKVQKQAADQGISVSIGIGGYYDNPYLLHLSFKEARSAMIDRFFQGNQLIFHFSDLVRKKKETGSPITPEERMELQALMRIADEEGVQNCLKELMEKLAKTYQQDVEVFKTEVLDLLMLLTRTVLETTDSPTRILAENAAIVQDLYQTIRYDHFVRKVCGYSSRLTRSMDPHLMHHVSPMIKKALFYTKENLEQKISLKEVAHYCSLSLHYFSHLFKKETGCSFVDYLNQLRIKKAQFYLQQTEWTVQQIAHKIGFEDANYFTRLFKRYVKMTPTQYRRAKSS